MCFNLNLKARKLVGILISPAFLRQIVEDVKLAFPLYAQDGATIYFTRQC
jgi:hypothetical protein